MNDMMVPFLDLQRAFEAFGPELDDCVRRVAKSGHYILGENVAALEQAATEYLKVEHVVTVASGTDALQLAVVAAGIGAGDEVITTPFTFAATLEAIEYAGARPVLVDIEPDTFNIDPQRIAEAITPRTRGILPVHLFGLPADMDAIMDIAGQHNLVVIEDCAQSLGARLNNKATGSIGSAGTFSFYPSKTLGCFGDGGMIATNDAEIRSRLLELRNHGMDTTGEHVRLGFNSRLDEIQAAILCIKLPHLDAMNTRRRQIAGYYNSTFSQTVADLQASGEGAYHAYGYYTFCVPDRDRLRQQLLDAGISTALYYGKPLHRHVHYSESCKYGALPVAEKASECCLSLPIFPEMNDVEVEYVATTTVKALA